MKKKYQKKPLNKEALKNYNEMLKGKSAPVKDGATEPISMTFEQFLNYIQGAEYEKHSARYNTMLKESNSKSCEYLKPYRKPLRTFENIFDDIDRTEFETLAIDIPELKIDIPELNPSEFDLSVPEFDVSIPDCDSCRLKAYIQ